MEPFTLPQGEPTEAQGTFVIFPQAHTETVPPEIAGTRAEKYNFGLGEMSPGADQLRAQMQMGNERYIRLKAITDENVRRERVKMELTNDIMRSKGGEPLSEEELATVQKLRTTDTNQLLSNPDTVLEKLYGRKVIDTSHVLSAVSAYERYLTENPDRADEIDSRSADIVAKKEVAQKLLEDVKGRWQNAGMWATASNYLEVVVPGFTWYNIQNALKGPKMGGFLPGENMEGQVTSYYTMGLDEASTALRATIQEMEAANPLDAMNYLNSIIGYTRNDKLIDNIMGVLDLTTPVPLAKPVRTIAAGKAMAEAMREVVKVSAKTPVARPEELLEAIGETAKATSEYLMKRGLDAERLAAREGQQASWEDMFGKLPLTYNTKAFVEGGELAKTAGFADRVARELTATTDKWVQGTLVTPINIARIVPGTPAFESAIEEAMWRVGAQSPHAVDNFAYANWTLAADNISGVNYANLHYGRRGGQPFPTQQQAEGFNLAWGLGADVVNEGNGFYLRKQIAINEADLKTRSLLHETTAKTPKSFANLALSWLRTPDDLLPADIVTDRKIAAYGITQVAQFGRDMMREVGAGLSKQEQANFKTYITKQRDYIEPKSGQRGRFDTNLAEFEQNWLKAYDALPTEAIAMSYMRYVQISNLDLVQRSIINYKNKTSLGIQNVTIPTIGHTLEARIVRDSPFNQLEDFSFMILDAKSAGADKLTEKGIWYPSANGGRFNRKEVVERIDRDGLVAVHVTPEAWEAWKANPEWSNKLPRKQVDYIFTANPKANPLPLNQVPDRPGGHVKLVDGYMVSQANLSRGTFRDNEVNYYRGDRNFLHFATQSDANKYAAHIENMRLMLKDVTNPKMMENLSAYIDKHLPGLMSADDFVRQFEKGYDIDSPFLVKPMGRTLHETHNLGTKISNFRVAPLDVHDTGLQRKDPAFLGERGDIFPTIRYNGSPDNPSYTFGPAELVDPLETMESAFHSVINARYLDDLRIKSAERFISEFASVLDTPIAELRAHPFKYLQDPVWKAGGDKELINAGRNYRRTTLEFLGIETPFERQIGYFKQKMGDAITGIGSTKLLNAYNWASTKDPIQFMRSFAFHEKLGLFNPKQLFLQANNMATAIAIEGPVRGGKAAMAYPVIRALMNNNTDEVLSSLSKSAKLVGWTEKEIKESFDAINRTGFLRVGDEYSDVSKDILPNITQTTFGRALDQAAFFFREGERMSRITAWNAAYLRWRELNPKGVMDNAAVASILSRADLLNGNMSRASNASWQRGALSVPTQFWSYQVRLGEMFLGKRLTPAEKARLVAGYSLMYGIPTGVAVTGAGVLWPFQDATRQFLIENGYEGDMGILMEGLTNGVLGVATNFIYGEPTNYNRAYAPQGLDVFKDLWTGDKHIFELALGASGSIMYQNFQAIKPFAANVMRSFGADGGHGLTVRDFTDVVSNISSLGNLAKAWHAYTFQEYITKNENLLSNHEVSAAQAAMTAMTGLTPRTLEDAYSMTASLKDRKAAQEEIRKEAIKNLRLSFKATNVDEANMYLRRAQINIEAGRFTIDEHSKIISQAARGFESMIDSISNKFEQAQQAKKVSK